MTRPAFRAGKRTLPRLPQTIRSKWTPCATPSFFGPSLQVPISSCGVLAVSSLAANNVRSLWSEHPGSSRRRLPSASSSDRPNAVPLLRRGSAVGHLRSLLVRPRTRHSLCVSGTGVGRAGEDGRIGYWYTHSRFARGASARRALQRGLRGLREAVENAGAKWLPGPATEGKNATGRQGATYRLRSATARTIASANRQIGKSANRQIGKSANRQIGE